MSDKALTLATVGAVSTHTPDLPSAAPSEDALRVALSAGYHIGQYLARVSPEERNAFRLGLLGAWSSPSSH